MLQENDFFVRLTLKLGQLVIEAADNTICLSVADNNRLTFLEGAVPV